MIRFQFIIVIWDKVISDNLEDDIEYFIRADTADDGILQWPATAGKINQTVVVMP